MLADELLLLALDDERGTVYSAVQIGLDFGLAGAVVAELAARGRLVGDDALSIEDGVKSGNAVLDDAMAAIAAKPGKDTRYWVGHLPRALGGLHKRLLDGLVAQGTLERRDQRILLLFHRDVFPERDGRVEQDVRARLDAVLLHGGPCDQRTRWLIQLAAACRITDAIYPRAQRATVKSRIKQLDTADDVASSAVDRAIKAEQAAIMGAIIAASVAATAASTAAACSAASSAC
jgi:hypothetical protein